MSDILDSMTEIVTNSFIGFGVDPSSAQCRVAAIVAELSYLWGGTLVYVKKNRDSNVVAERNSQIVQKYDGNNSRELARQFQLSQATIYAIVKRSKEAKQSN